MTELRKKVTALLKGVCNNTYFQSVPETVSYPYLVYDMSTTITDGEGYEMITLDVDLWDQDYDSDRVESLMISVRNTLDKRILGTDDFDVTFYLENILSLSDPDPKIRRRRCTFFGNLYGKGN